MNGARHAIVVPCFDEAARLQEGEIAALAREVDVLLVDDGSTDGTRALLTSLSRALPGVRALCLDHNVGKAEAVRAGLLAAIDGGAAVVGYADADFATSARELLRLLSILTGRPRVDVVLGSRVARLGAEIDRRASRHVGGRVFATLASWTLAAPVYDTQCGAKWLRRTPALDGALARPFATRWAFDVELLARLLGRLGDGPTLAPSRMLEVPLDVWRDAGGSKLGLAGQVRGAVEVATLLVRARARTVEPPSGS